MRVMFLVLILTLAGCVSAPARELENVRPGMDKDEVLEAAGNPKRTFRAAGQDHWVYVFYRAEQEFLQQTDFVDGKVLKVLAARPKLGLTRDLENAESMEEFEAKVREHQKSAKGK